MRDVLYGVSRRYKKLPLLGKIERGQSKAGYCPRDKMYFTVGITSRGIHSFESSVLLVIVFCREYRVCPA